MNRKMLRILLSIFILPFVFTSCLSSPVGADIQDVINEACFEVVVKKDKNDSLTYEKELPWDSVNFTVRNDDYIPIGTAFAVSEDRFVTASHVLSLLNNSIVYDTYYLRNSAGDVFEVENLYKFHNSKDFVLFSAKGLTNKKWLNIREDYQLNEPVLQVGNIYGQGIVAVPGTVHGSKPEPNDGAWENIKSSPPNDHGSSGGPLLDENLNVIGIIIQKDENFCYSVPLSEMTASPENKGIIASKFHFLFDLLPGHKSNRISFDMDIDLPMDLKTVKDTIQESYVSQYDGNMQDFFDTLGGEFFPEGKSSKEALQNATTSSNLQLLFKNENDGRWLFTNLDKTRGQLENNGAVKYSVINSTIYLDVFKPDNISHNELYNDPKVIMDLIFEGINIPREMAGQKIRITSLGEPVSVEKYSDRYGRKWNFATWLLEYSDRVALFMYTPTPDGIAAVLRFTESSDINSWMYDLKVIADLTYIPYTGSIENWKEFLNQDEHLYGIFKNMKLDYEVNGQVSIDSDVFSLNLDSKSFTVEDKMNLTMSHDFFMENDEVVWGLRKINMSEDSMDNYFVSYRFIKPGEGLPRGFYTDWDDFVGRKHPYNGTFYTEEGRTNIGTLHPAFTGTEDSVFSIYIGMEGNLSEDKMMSQLKSVQNGLKFK